MGNCAGYPSVLPNNIAAAVGSARALTDTLLARYAACVRVELIASQVVHPRPSVLPIADPEGRVTRMLNVDPAGELILVRPDGYIGYRCDVGTPELLDQFLDSFLIAQK